jgi:nitrite reductase/ring-hydroxylating ferredoxin subunit
VICADVQDLPERVADMAGHDGVSKAIEFVCGHVGAAVARALTHTVRWSSTVRCPRTAKPIRQNYQPDSRGVP